MTTCLTVLGAWLTLSVVFSFGFARFVWNVDVREAARIGVSSRASLRPPARRLAVADLVILAETNGSRWVSLKWSGRALYAVMSMSSWRSVRGPVAIEFHRAEDGSS